MLVSILIPCFNAERWIGEAIESALAQTWREKEVLVIDDGSTDGSLDVLKRFSKHILWESGSNQGANAARNRLLGLARGEWLQYLDADDYLLEDKIRGQIQFISDHPEVDVVYGPITVECWSNSGVQRQVLEIPEPHDPWVLLAGWQLPQTGASLWRKQAIIDVGGWQPDQPCCQEHELYLRLLMAGKRFKYFTAEGGVYREWSDATLSKRNRLEVCRRRIEITTKMEKFLSDRQALTPARRQAINEGKFNVARVAWQINHHFATDIMASVFGSHPGYIPARNLVHRSYLAVFRTLGFPMAELFADGWRRIRSRVVS